jgi:tetratricopeptide (TPR) repeat protein/MinD-like ATPase involved in chromosome partitioning or flagellar assembly
MIFTFYSFKGGVGRSMTLANLAEMLHKRGLNVLMIDFDLEAPGLERYFDTSEDLTEKRGVIDMVLSYKTLSSLSLPNITSEQQPTPEEFAKSIEPLANFISTIYPEQNGAAGLYLMTAGRRPKDDYKHFSESVSRLDWDDFYINCNGAMFFNWLRAEASRYFDVVLLDSRTGITEMTGICTYHLADVVIMFVAPNQQNLEGTLLIANGLRKRAEQDGTKRDRKLELLILPSRVDTSESTSVQDFKNRFLELMVPLLPTLKFENSPFDDLKIPYIARYAFYEKVAAREPELSVATEMLGAFNRILAALVEIANKSSRFYRRYFSKTRSASIVADETWLPKTPDNFIGRFWVFNAIDQWLANPGSTLLIQGEPGSGKSALSLRLVQISRGEVENQDWSYIVPGLLVYAHFCNPVNLHSYDPAYFVKSLSLALANRYQEFATALTQTRETDVRIEVRQSIGSLSPGAQATGVVIESVELVNPDVMRGLSHLVTEPLAKLYSQGFNESPVILVDGLDVATSSVSGNNIVSVISHIVRRSPQVRFILTSRPDPRVMAELSGAEILDLVSHSESLNEDIRNYVETNLGTFLPIEMQSDVVEQILQAAQGNFLYAEHAVTALKTTTDLKVFDPGRTPGGLLGFYRDAVANQIGSDIERWKTKDSLFLGVLVLQKGKGLTSSQLSGILGWTETEMTRIVSGWRQYLTRDWPHAPFQFFHNSFRDFLLTNTEYAVLPPQCHQLIADYFVKQYGADWSSCEDEYALNYTSAHLMDAFNSATDTNEKKAIQEKLTAVLTDPDFLEVRGKRVGTDGLLKELKEAPEAAGILGNLAKLYTELARPNEAIATYERAVKLAQADDDRRLENALLGNLGLTFTDLSRWDEAIKTFQEAVTLAHAIGDRQSEATHLGNLGLAYRSIGNISAALKSLSRALHISREVGSKRNEAFWLVNLGYVYVLQREFPEAIKHYTEALSIFQSLEDLASCATLYSNLGLAHEAMKDFTKAIESYRQAAQILKSLGDKSGLAAIWLRFGNLFANAEHWDQAAKFYQRALTAWEEAGETALAARAQVNLGIVLAKQGERVDAVTHFEHALSRMGEIGDREGIGRVLFNLGNVATEQERLKEAEIFYLKAVKILEEVGPEVDVGQVWNNLGTIYRRQGDWKLAIETYSRSLEIARKVGDQKIEGDVLSNLGNAFQGLGDLVNARMVYQNAQRVLEKLGDEKGAADVREKLEAIRFNFTRSHDGGRDIVIGGNVSGSEVQPIKGVSVSMGQNIRKSELDDLLMPLTTQIRNVPPDSADQVQGAFQALKAELAKGNQADDRVLARTVDKLISQVPATGETLADLLTSPRLGTFVGPVTQFVIEKFLESSPSGNRKNT